MGLSDSASISVTPGALGDTSLGEKEAIKKHREQTTFLCGPLALLQRLGTGRRGEVENFHPPLHNTRQVRLLSARRRGPEFHLRGR